MRLIGKAGSMGRRRKIAAIHNLGDRSAHPDPRAVATERHADTARKKVLEAGRGEADPRRQIRSGRHGVRAAEQGLHGLANSWVGRIRRSGPAETHEIVQCQIRPSCTRRIFPKLPHHRQITSRAQQDAVHFTRIVHQAPECADPTQGRLDIEDTDRTVAHMKLVRQAGRNDRRSAGVPGGAGAQAEWAVDARQEDRRSMLMGRVVAEWSHEQRTFWVDAPERARQRR